MRNRHFVLKNILTNNLYSLGFRKVSFYDDECKYFKYKFPVYKYKGRMVLECEIVVNGKTGEVVTNIYDDNHSVYTPYYDREFGNHEEMIDKINKEILAEFKRLGIEEVE